MSALVSPGRTVVVHRRRCHNDARRVMTKALLRDLWVEWRRASALTELTADAVDRRSRV